MSVLVICEIPWHFTNFLSAGDKHSLRNSENSLQPIQIQFSKNWIIFFFLNIFLYFFNLYINFWTFWRKQMTLIGYVFAKLQTAKDCIRPMSKEPLSEHPLTVNILNGP